MLVTVMCTPRRVWWLLKAPTRVPAGQGLIGSLMTCTDALLVEGSWYWLFPGLMCPKCAPEKINKHRDDLADGGSGLRGAAHVAVGTGWPHEAM